jgi:hypothetical protein
MSNIGILNIHGDHISAAILLLFIIFVVPHAIEIHIIFIAVVFFLHVLLFIIVVIAAEIVAIETRTAVLFPPSLLRCPTTLLLVDVAAIIVVFPIGILREPPKSLRQRVLVKVFGNYPTVLV